jgi:hypothetical protein
MRIRNIIVASVALALACPVWVNAQPPSHIETRTRLVTQFSSLQTEWLNAIKARNAAALDHLLSEDFEVWTPGKSGPIPREDWQAQAFAENLKSFRVADMAVKSPRDGVAIESFRLDTTVSRNGSETTQQFFVVNLWVGDKDSWRCTDSYVSPVAASPPSAPAKPSGKG